jgi:Acyl-CoA dehydrogenases
MELELDPATVAFRDEVRAWLRAHVPTEPLPSLDTADGFAAHRAWERKLADARLSVVSWPRAYGGRDASLEQWVVFEEEYWAAGAPARVSQNGIFLLAPTLFAHGTDEQLARVLPPMARGDEIWAQAWSEPEAGSDLAAIRSVAVRVERVGEVGGGGWLLSGQKTWSSRATYADRGFGLFRTNPAAERHQGLTYFLFDLHADGVTVRGIPQLDGEPGFAEIFLDDVFVPDADVLGEVGDGWRAAMSTASNERGLSLRPPDGSSPPLTGSSRWRTRARTPRSPIASSTPGSGRGRTSCTLGRPSPAWRAAARWARSRRSASCSGRSSTSGCTRPRSTCSARARNSPVTGWPATCSRWPGRSTRVRTRSSATSWPNVCWGCHDELCGRR